MKIFKNPFVSKKAPETPFGMTKATVARIAREAQASGPIYDSASYDADSRLLARFTGATVPGTMSLPQVWKLDYYALRERSWQAYTENELASAYLDRLRHFVINTGLRMQYEPSKLIGDLTDETKDMTEAAFAVYAGSNISSYDNSCSLHAKADQAYLNSCAGGDMLVILHIVKGQLKVQHIDGRNVVNPGCASASREAAIKGNTILQGVEYDKRGREVAYHVKQDNHFLSRAIGDYKDRSKVERIPAYGRSGRRIAFMVSRNNQRIGGGRGKPILTPVLQNLEITKRYKTAELMAAEVNAQLVASIEHDESSFGTNPISNLPYGGGRHATGQEQDLSNAGWSTDSGDQIAGRVASTTNAMVVNMGRGQKLKFSDTKRPNVQGVEFTKLLNVDTAAAVSIPFEVAQMQFTNSYSASRAALEMFKIIIQAERKQFSDQYYGIIAQEWLRLNALTGKIPMPDEYRTAVLRRDEFTQAAYETFRFTGIVVPHVDPLKEVNAAIERINNNLSTREQETEGLGTGDFGSNADRLEKEQKILEEKGLLTIVDENNPAEGDTPDDGDDEQGEDNGSTEDE